MKRSNLQKDIAIGALAGFAGTTLIQGMLAGSRKIAPETLPPLKDDPGHFIVKQAERILPRRVQEKVPEKLETTAAYSLAFGYGVTFASLYSAMRRKRMNVWLDGAALGTLTWAAGYLGWLPVAKLMPPIWKQTPKQVVPNILSHVLFGIATVSFFKWARRKV